MRTQTRSIALAAAVLFAAACGNAERPAPAGGAPAPAAAGAAPEAAPATPAPAPVGAAAPAERMTLGISQEFENLNPLIMQMSASNYIYYLVGHPLVSINPDWQFECWLCTEIPTLDNGGVQIIEQNGQKKLRATWEFKPGASWGDGTPMSGKDIELTWKIGNSPNVSVPSKEPYEVIEAVEIDPSNPRRFTLQLKEPRYNYYQLAAQLVILPAHIEAPIWEKTKDTQGAYEKQTAYNTNPENPGLYSGPYRISEIELGSHVAVVPNEHFYDAARGFKQFVVKLVPNTQTLEANLISHNIDMISEIGMTFDQALAFEKRTQRDAALKAYQTKFRQGLIYEHIDLNLRNPMLTDLRVRKALVYALDRQKLVDSLFEGRQEVALSNIHPLDPYYTDDVTKYPYDPERAGVLLDEAGWAMDKDGYRHKDGKKLSLQIMTTAQNKTRELVQVVLQDQWKKVGVELTIRNEPARVFFGETVRKAQYTDMAMYAWTTSPDNPPRETLHSSQIPTEANAWSGQNSCGWKDDVVDKALDAVRTEFDFDKRKALMKTIQQEYTEQVPVIPLYLRSEISVVPAQLQNYQLTGHQYYSTLRAQRWTMQ